MFRSVRAASPDRVEPRQRHAEAYHWIGRRLAVLRTACGLTQVKVAEHLGISFQQVQKYEQGVNRISAVDLAQLAELFGCTFGDLLGAGEGDPIPTTKLDRWFLELSREWASLTSDQKSAVLQLARAVNSARQTGA